LSKTANKKGRCGWLVNEILMCFRNQKKTAQDISMSELTLFWGTA